MDVNSLISILIIDDDERILRSLSLVLGEWGYKTFPCRNAGKALRTLQNTGVDTVLADVRISGESGIEPLEKIHEQFPDLPVILMTAYAELDIAVEAIRKGAFDFILKPFTGKQVYHSVRRA